MKQLTAAASLIGFLLVVHLMPGHHYREAFLWGALLGAIPAMWAMAKGQSDITSGEQMQQKNVRPLSNAALPYEDILHEQEQAASLGLDPTTSLQLTMANRGLSSSLNTALQTGANPNTAADVYGNYSDNLDKIAGINYERRMTQVNNVVAAMQGLAGARLADWEQNKWKPFADTAQLAAAKIQSGQNLWQGGLGLADYALTAATAKDPYAPDKEPPPTPGDVPQPEIAGAKVRQPLVNPLDQFVNPTRQPIPNPALSNVGAANEPYNPWKNMMNLINSGYVQ